MTAATTNAALVTTLALFATYALTRYKLTGKENIFFWTITNRMAPAAVFRSVVSITCVPTLSSMSDSRARSASG